MKVATAGDTGSRWRGRRRGTGELTSYLCWSPRPVPLHALVRVAGSRWSIEELFQTGRGQVGLDRQQVRVDRLRRHTTLAMLALAVLTILVAQQADADPQVIALTVAGIHRLLSALVLALPLPPAHSLHWSTWRRTFQARARRSLPAQTRSRRQPEDQVTFEY